LLADGKKAEFVTFLGTSQNAKKPFEPAPAVANNFAFGEVKAGGN
jgi:hypothetical protein